VDLLSLAALSRLLRLERLIVDDAIVARVETIRLGLVVAMQCGPLRMRYLIDHRGWLLRAMQSLYTRWDHLEVQIVTDLAARQVHFDCDALVLDRV